MTLHDLATFVDQFVLQTHSNSGQTTTFLARDGPSMAYLVREMRNGPDEACGDDAQRGDKSTKPVDIRPDEFVLYGAHAHGSAGSERGMKGAVHTIMTTTTPNNESAQALMYSAPSTMSSVANFVSFSVLNVRHRLLCSGWQEEHTLLIDVEILECSNLQYE